MNNNYKSRKNNLIPLSNQWFNGDGYTISISLSQSIQKERPDFYVFLAVKSITHLDTIEDYDIEDAKTIRFRLDSSQCFEIAEAINLIAEGRTVEVESFAIKTDPSRASYKCSEKMLKLGESWDKRNKVTQVSLEVSEDKE